jgi:hypothetical protein
MPDVRTKWEAESDHRLLRFRPRPLRPVRLPSFESEEEDSINVISYR